MHTAAVSQFDVFSRRGQEITMVLYALRTKGGNHAKQEILQFIRENRFYDLQPHDKCSYEGKREWKAETLLCWGRKDAVIGDWLFDHDERDSWELTGDGRKALDEIITRFRDRSWDIRQCYLWTPAFKTTIDPTYVRSSRDAARPASRHPRVTSSYALRILAELCRKKPEHPGA